MLTSGHTFAKTVSVISRISLCLYVGKVTLGQLSASSTKNGLSQAHEKGKREAIHPYHKAMASLNSLLLRAKPSFPEEQWSARQTHPFPEQIAHFSSSSLKDWLQGT